MEKQIIDENSRINAANSVVLQGQNILQETLVNKKIKKESIVKANSMIKLAMDNSETAKKNLVVLTEKKENN